LIALRSDSGGGAEFRLVSQITGDMLAPNAAR
jgi:hypothetical protein